MADQPLGWAVMPPLGSASAAGCKRTPSPWVDTARFARRVATKGSSLAVPDPSGILGPCLMADGPSGRPRIGVLLRVELACPRSEARSPNANRVDGFSLRRSDERAAALPPDPFFPPNKSPRSDDSL
jgi:hypothetical protein